MGRKKMGDQLAARFFKMRGKQEEKEEVKEEVKEEEMLEMNVPDDIINNEILLRLPVHSLIRFKWVCKSWFNLITHPVFVKKHLHHSTRDDHQIMNRTLVLNRDGKVLYSRKYQDMFDTSSSMINKPAFMLSVNHPFGSRFMILGSCNGLVYLRSAKAAWFSSRDYHKYFIWNPSTTEFKKLADYGRVPFRKVCLDVDGFGYDPTIDDYKVIRINHIKTGNYNDNVPTILSKIHIYTLGSNSWSTKIKNVNPVLQTQIHASFFSLFSDNTAGVLVNGSLHWLLRGFRFVVLCFDIVNEKHQEIQLPPTIIDIHVHVHKILVQVLNECLCIYRMDRFSHNTELWIMKDYGVKESWTKLFTIKGKSLDKEFSGFGENYWCYYKWERLKYYREDGGIIMLYKSKYLITYYTGNNTFTIEKTSTKFGKIYVNCYIESLVSVNSGLYLTDAGPTKTIPYIDGKKRGEVKSKINHLKRVW